MGMVKQFYMLKQYDSSQNIFVFDHIEISKGTFKCKLPISFYDYLKEHYNVVPSHDCTTVHQNELKVLALTRR